MSTRAEALADQFEAANNEAIAQVSACSEGVWNAATPNDGRTVRVVAYHIASSHEGILGLIQAVANVQPVPPITPEMIDAGNAQQAQEKANVSKDEVTQALQQNGAAAVSAVRSLSDEQLDKTISFWGNDWTTQLMIERILIGHTNEHLNSIRAAG